MERIGEALMAGNAQLVKELTEQAVFAGVRPINVVKQGLEPAMQVIGNRFREFKINIPEVLKASRAMQAGLYVLKPLLLKNKSAAGGKIVLGTVSGDLHDIGKNLVGMMLVGAGYEVIDIGIDVPAEKFIDTVKKYRPNILGMSALLTTTMVEFQNVISLLEKKDLRTGLKIIVGGAPVTANFARAVGADAYAGDAWIAAQVVEKLNHTPHF